MEDEVIETMMFERPPEWGRRIVKRGNEIILQGTGDKGKTWQDSDQGSLKLFIDQPSLRSTSTNPYSGLTPENGIQTRTTANSPKKLRFSEEIQAVVDTGQILNKHSKNEVINGRSREIETISFLGGIGTWDGLSPGQIWRDEDNYLRIVPDK